MVFTLTNKFGFQIWALQIYGGSVFSNQINILLLIIDDPKLSTNFPNEKVHGRSQLHKLYGSKSPPRCQSMAETQGEIWTTGSRQLKGSTHIAQTNYYEVILLAVVRAYKFILKLHHSIHFMSLL